MAAPIEDVLILAGGLGTRMAPFDMARPKCLLPVLTRPLLLHLLERTQRAGAERWTVVVSERFAPMVAHTLRAWPQIRTVSEKGPEGSGAAAHQGAAQVPETRPLMILEGDTLISQDDLNRVHRALDGPVDAALLVAPMEREMPQDWIVAEVDGERVVKLWGHPRDGLWRVGGAYALSPAARPFVGEARQWGVEVPVGGMPPTEYDLAESFNGMLAQGLRVVAVKAQDPVVNLDKPWHIVEANQVAQRERFIALSGREVAPTATISPDAHIEGPVSIGEHSRIGPGVVIRGPAQIGARSVVDNGVILADGVTIGDDCQITDFAKISHAQIGNRSVIGHCAEVVGGVVMENVYMTHYCEMYGVLGDNVDIGAATVCGTLRFDDALSLHRVRGRWEHPFIGANAVYIGDYCRTGVNVTMLPGRRIGPYSVVGPGVVVDEDIGPRQMVKLVQTKSVSAWGPERYGW